MSDKIPNTMTKRSFAGRGCFALREFKKNQVIEEYTGQKISNRAAESRNSLYLFDSNDGKTIDGSTKRNRARYMNHSCKPNAWVYTRGGRVFIKAKRRIKVGEEITYSYGEEYYNDILAKKGCRCGHCSGKIGAKLSKKLC